jgi:plastocyanin
MRFSAATSALLVAAIAAAAIHGHALAHPLAETGTGSVRGSVTVHERSFFGGLREREDRSSVVVYVTGFVRSAASRVATLAQKNKRFDPKILPIVRGQTIQFPNNDPIYHNVFSVSAIHEFDLGQYRSGDPPRSEVFDKPGLVPVYCNIHPDMIAYVVVLENDAFAVTAADGSFVIPNVPAGRLTLNAWMPGAQRISEDVEVHAGEETRTALDLVQSEKIAPHKRKDGSDYPKPRSDDY